MKRFLLLGLFMAILAGFAVPTALFSGATAASAATSQTYDVLVGLENPNRGVEVNSYFPSTVTVHVGDTVHWIQDTREIHTVTFLAGADINSIPIIVPAPAGSASPLMFNPVFAFPAGPANGQYDGSTFVNSGLMGMDPGQVREFSLSFTKPGSYEYVCLVHGVMMSGTVIVVPADQPIASPAQAQADGKQQMAKGLAMVSDVMKEAESRVPAPEANPDGTTTYRVLLGYTSGEIDLMRFFPEQLVVHPGDTVEWYYDGSDAPHTMTFLNGAEEPELVTPVPQPNGPPLLLLNPEVLFPGQAGQPLTRQGVFNSGLLTPGQTFSLQVGDVTGLIRYVCLLHDEAGMEATLVITPRKGGQ